MPVNQIKYYFNLNILLTMDSIKANTIAMNKGPINKQNINKLESILFKIVFIVSGPHIIWTKAKKLIMIV